MAESPGTVYTKSFFEWQAEGSLASAREVVPLVMEFVRPSSVVDVGCGLGTWLSVFREYGVERLLGLDGNHVDVESLMIPRERFLAVDLREPFSHAETFDLCVSLEVAEHLAADFRRGLRGFAGEAGTGDLLFRCGSASGGHGASKRAVARLLVLSVLPEGLRQARSVPARAVAQREGGMVVSPELLSLCLAGVHARSRAVPIRIGTERANQAHARPRRHPLQRLYLAQLCSKDCAAGQEAPGPKGLVNPAED
ncbi:MAG: class I SAM-dependent methyltransferase [Candidatus Rokubacteria bacterium]|nr:class I SAM-dependent methyltransferase [Candidatus Rokubacteria bacterium]